MNDSPFNKHLLVRNNGAKIIFFPREKRAEICDWENSHCIEKQ